MKPPGVRNNQKTPVLETLPGGEAYAISGESWKFNPGPLDWDFITEDNAGRAIAHNQAFKDSIRGIAERAFKKQLINLGKSTKHTGRLLSLLDALQEKEHPLEMLREIEEPFALFEAKADEELDDQI